MYRRIALSMLVALAATGCQGSRWAKTDPKYVQKYPHHSDSVLRTAKQAVDARQVAGRRGFYAGAAARDTPAAAGLQAGALVYPPGMKGMVETRAGLAGLIVEGDQPLSGGVETGVRLQLPTRLAPFVGATGYAGYVPDLLAGNDGRDNDNNGLIDEPLEDDSTAVFAGGPELGAHFWITPRWRLTASASHYFTTDRGASDYTLYGLSLAKLHIPAFKYPRPKARGYEDARAFESANNRAPPNDEAPLRLPPIE